MVLTEIIHTWSHAKVAEAAISSIGPDLVRDIEERAREEGLGAGPFVAKAVQTFARKASQSDWHQLAMHISGADMPVLAGLLHILETRLPDAGSGAEVLSGGGAYKRLSRAQTMQMRYCA